MGLSARLMVKSGRRQQDRHMVTTGFAGLLDWTRVLDLVHVLPNLVILILEMREVSVSWPRDQSIMYKTKFLQLPPPVIQTCIQCIYIKSNTTQ